MPKTVARNYRQLEMPMGLYGGPSATRSRHWSTARGLDGKPVFISVRSCGEAPEVRGPKRSAEVTSKQIEGLLQENLPAAMTGRHLRSRDLRGRQLRAHAVRRAHKGLQFLERHEARQRL